MSNQLQHLLHDIQHCRHCAEHLPLGANPVIQVSRQANILIAGQAPGRKVHETGIPFNDPSGNRLRKWLGISPEVFYDATQIALLPMGFCYPGTGKQGDLPPRPECAERWREQLLKRLPNIQLTLAIGQYAQAYHLGKHRKKNLTETVKSWQDFWPDKIPLPHPSPRNNRWLRNNPWFEEELIPVLQKRISELLHPFNLNE